MFKEMTPFSGTNSSTGCPIPEAIAMAWAKKHLEEFILEDGNVSKRLYITHEKTGDRLILNRDFFTETFAKNNKKRNTSIH